MARDAGANNVYFASAAPPVKYPNVYGIDMPARNELIASGHSVEEVCKIIGADRLIFQDLDDLIEAVQDKHSDAKNLTVRYLTVNTSPVVLMKTIWMNYSVNAVIKPNRKIWDTRRG